MTDSMFVSLFPDWTGQTQPRRVQLDGDTLRLGTVSPIRSSGKEVNSVLTWRRWRTWTPTIWESVLAVNMTGTFNVTRLTIPHLKKSSAGAIINLSSVGGRFCYPERSPYAATKRGIIALPETLAIDGFSQAAQ